MVSTKTCKTFRNKALHAPIEPWPLIWKKKKKKEAIFNIFFNQVLISQKDDKADNSMSSGKDVFVIKP